MGERGKVKDGIEAGMEESGEMGVLKESREAGRERERGEVVYIYILDIYHMYIYIMLLCV